VSIFHRLDLGERHLAAALLALLEHADRSLLTGLLERAGIAAPALESAEFLYPAPDGPPGAGEVRTPHWRGLLLAVGPSGDGATVLPVGLPTLLISPTGRPVHGAETLSWEQVDRWLAAEAERYGPESRTGFLIRQFRAFLPEVGIAYFAGFAPALLEGVGQAFGTISQFLATAGELFERLGPALPAGLREVRQARPEDLVAGLQYRDYAGGVLGGESFWRIAFHLGRGELQLACWLAAGGAAHGRLRAAALQADERWTGLQSMEPPLLLRLWSPAGEQQIPAAEIDPEAAGQIAWDQFTVALQVAYPLHLLGGEGLVERIGDWSGDLLERLAPLLAGTVH